MLERFPTDLALQIAFGTDSGLAHRISGAGHIV